MIQESIAHPLWINIEQMNYYATVINIAIICELKNMSQITIRGKMAVT